MMFGRELRLPDQLNDHPPQLELDSTQQYVVDIHKRMETAQALLRDQPQTVRDGDSEEPLMFKKGDWVLMINKRRRKGQNPKLQHKFVGPYVVVESYPSHTYKLERQNQVSIQNEGRLKMYRPCGTSAGQAPGLIEPTRRPNMKGIVGKVKPPQELLTETTQQDNIPKIPAVDNPMPKKPFFRVAAPPAATQRSALQEELGELIEKLGRRGTNTRRPHLEIIPEDLEERDEGSETEEVVDGGGERPTPEVVEEPSQVTDRSDRIPTMPFHKTRSGRVSQPP
jgi:hypothetical protein